MCSVELKVTIGLLVKWFYSIYKMRFLELDTLTKQKYEKITKLIGQKQHVVFVILNYRLM